MEKMLEMEHIRKDVDELFDGVLPPRKEPVELNDLEKLAVAQAFMNRVGEMTSTKDGWNLRGRVNAAMVDLYAETGAKSFDVKLRGRKVGTYSLTVSKPTESREQSDFVVFDRDAFAKWPDFDAVAYNYALEHMREVAEWHFGMTGEVPDGCEMQTYVVAGDPGGRVTRSTLRVDADEVVRAIGGELEGAARMMLEGGADE